MKVYISILAALVLTAHCGNTGIYDEATTNYVRIVRSGLNEWYPLNGNLTSRLGSPSGSPSGSITAGTNRAGETGKATCMTASALNFTNTTLAANPFTISAWFRFNTIPAGTNTILQKGAACTTYSGLKVDQTAGATVNLDHGSCGASPGFLTTNMITQNIWIFLSFSYSGGTGNLYLAPYGGNIVNLTSTPPKDYLQNANPFQMFPGANVNACVDDLLNYNRALTAAEVQQNFQSLE